MSDTLPEVTAQHHDHSSSAGRTGGPDHSLATHSPGITVHQRPPSVTLPVDAESSNADSPSIAVKTTEPQDKNVSEGHSRLPLDNSLSEFGSKGDYWKKYHDATAPIDKAMLKRLGGDLDILLIFAGLFSAVDTAFIAVTLPMLSAGPNDETNFLLRAVALRGSNVTYSANDLAPPLFSPPSSATKSNAFFIASLSLSLLASFGAVLGKQWLSHAEIPRLGGSPQTQGQHRQMMFTGMEKWHLKGTIDVLPMILQLALLSFWLGLITLLWSLSRTVACVALAFAITGAVFYFYTAIAAVFDSSCPFQTPAIPLFRRALTAIFVLLVSLVPVGLGLTALTIVLSLFSAFILVVALPFFLFAWLVSFFPGQTASYKDVLGHILDTSRKGAPVTGTIFSTRTWIPPSLKSDKVPDDVDGNSARWVLESSVDDDLLLRTAMNITALRDLRSIFRLCYPTVSFLRLIVQLTTHVARLQQDVSSETDAVTEEKGLLSYNNLNAAVHYARSLIHVSLAAPAIQPDITFARSNTTLIEYIGALQSFEPPQSSAFNELRLFRYIVMDGMRYQQIPDIQGIEGLALPIYIAALMGPPYMFLNVPELAQEGIEEMVMYGSLEETERESRNETKRQQNRLRVITELALATLRTESSTRPSVLNLLSWVFAMLLGPTTAVSPNYGKVWHHRWEAYTDDASLFSNLGNALAYARAMTPSAISSDYPYDVAEGTSHPNELMEQVFQAYEEILKNLCAILSKRENGRKYEAQLRDAWPSLEKDINNMQDWLGSRPESQQKTTMSELLGSFAEAVRTLVSIQRMLGPAIETGQAGDGDHAGDMPTLAVEWDDGGHMMDSDRKKSVPRDTEKS